MTFEEQIVTHDEMNLSQIVEPAGAHNLDNSSLIMNQRLIKRLSHGGRKHNNSTNDVAEESKRELSSSGSSALRQQSDDDDESEEKMIATEREDIFTNFE